MIESSKFSDLILKIDELIKKKKNIIYLWSYTSIIIEVHTFKFEGT